MRNLLILAGLGWLFWKAKKNAQGSTTPGAANKDIITGWTRPIPQKEFDKYFTLIQDAQVSAQLYNSEEDSQFRTSVLKSEDVLSYKLRAVTSVPILNTEGDDNSIFAKTIPGQTYEMITAGSIVSSTGFYALNQTVYKLKGKMRQAKPTDFISIITK
ncbi:MAG: hypothetical protein PHX21_12905 [bacterium]|nr:hypothetical protein [bacterium]